MPSIYQLGNVAVLPSMWDEPAGMTMVEAVVSGLPLITTKSGGIPEYIPDDAAILLDRDENLVDNIKKSIVMIKNEPNKFESMLLNGRKLIRKYNLTDYYSNFESILME